MSNDLVVSQAKEIEIAENLGIEVNIYRALKYSLFPEASDISIGMYIAYCRAKDYDLLKKPMHIVSIGCKTNTKGPDGKDIYVTRDVIMPGIVSYRIDAHRTGTFFGISDAEFGPMITGTFGKNNIKVEYPEWCRLVIYKKIGDAVVHIPATLYWTECYSTINAFSDEPNRMWKKRPRAQLEKCCEALAYRKGFPEEIGGVPTHEEMEGRLTMDDLPGEKDITEESNESTPLSQSHTVDQAAVQKHIDAIKNCSDIDILQIAYKDAKAFAKGDKSALNEISKVTRERKSYLEQSKKTPAPEKEAESKGNVVDKFYKEYDSATGEIK